MCATRRFKSAAFSLTIKHVSEHERLDRDLQKSVGGGRSPAADSPGDGDAPANVEEDFGTQAGNIRSGPGCASGLACINMRRNLERARRRNDFWI